jgi:biopolymer transport protein ExbD
MAKMKEVESLECPMSAMIDVVFQLLIYFIITQKDEVPEAHLAVNLPSPDQAPVQQRNKPQLLEIEVHPGQILLQGVPRSLDMIQDTLTYLAKLDPDQTVIIKTNVMAKTSELVAVLDLCKGVGFKKLNIMTLK